MAGAVAAVPVSETQAVKAGDILVKLDPADATLAYQKAQADYEATVRKIHGDTATASALSAGVAAHNVDMDRAKAQSPPLLRTSPRPNWTMIGARAWPIQRGSGEDSRPPRRLVKTRSPTSSQPRPPRLKPWPLVTRPKASSRPSRRWWRARLTAILRWPPHAPPATAELDLDRTVIRAPLDEIISKKQVEVGQRVAVGATS